MLVAPTPNCSQVADSFSPTHVKQTELECPVEFSLVCHVLSFSATNRRPRHWIYSRFTAILTGLYVKPDLQKQSLSKFA